MTIVITYSIYLALSIALTVWVAKTLHKSGRIFLVDVFHGNEPLADSVNHLLVVGFYLINLGFVCHQLKIDTQIVTPQDSIEALAGKMGTVLLVLGGMHFLNLAVFTKFRNQAIEDTDRRQMIGQRPIGVGPFTA